VQPVLRLLRELGSRPSVRQLVVDKPGFRLELRGPGLQEHSLEEHSHKEHSGARS